MTNTETLISKVWRFADVLRDDGVGYGDYLEQLTYLLFLKLADEYTKPPYNRKLPIPDGYNWESILSKRGAELDSHYVKLLRELGKASGILGQIFTKSQNKIQDPAKLYRVIDMINAENWSLMGTDLKGKIYEGLLEKNAEDVKSGAGQYFTPRALIMAMVECIHPEPGKTICDPACGTGGFFLASYDFLCNPANYRLDKAQKEFLKDRTFSGNEIVASARRMCLMNMFLLKKNPLKFEDMTDFIACYNPENRHKRKETWSKDNPNGRWRKFSYDEIMARDKTNLDIFWVKDESLADLDNLPDPDILASEIIENVEAGLDSFKAIVETINGE